MVNRPGFGGGSDPREGGVVSALRKYPPELRECSRLLSPRPGREEPRLSLNQAVLRIGPWVGFNPDTLRGWCKQADIDSGRQPGDEHLRGESGEGARVGGARAQACQ